MCSSTKLNRSCQEKQFYPHGNKGSLHQYSYSLYKSLPIGIVRLCYGQFSARRCFRKLPPSPSRKVGRTKKAKKNGQLSFKERQEHKRQQAKKKELQSKVLFVWKGRAYEEAVPRH